MQAHLILIQAVLLPATLGNVLFSYQLGLRRPGWMLPSMAAVTASLAVLLASVVAGLRGPWLWAAALYAVTYPLVLLAVWRRAAREWAQGEPSVPVTDPPQTPALLLESENGHAVLVHGGGLRRPLVQGGQPAGALLPGWSVAAIHNGFSPLVVISLLHDDGHAARWIVDASNELYNGPVSQLPMTVRGILRAGVNQRLRDIRNRGEAALAAWNAVPRPTRLELMADLNAGGEAGENDPSAMMGEWEHDPGQALPICSDDDLLSVLLPTGVELPVLRAGTVLRHTDFLPGWAAETLGRGPAPFHRLELRHESGTRATWLLDRHLSVIGDINNLPRDVKEQLRSQAAPATASDALQGVIAGMAGGPGIVQGPSPRPHPEKADA